MIGFVLGTSEGKKILEEVNKFTDNIFVSTSTKYGSELLEKYSIKHLNSKPLNYEGFKEAIEKFNIKIFLDATHPYAKEIRIDDYSELKGVLENIDGTILNTTGSNNVDTINNLNLKNRVIHRILPSHTILKRLIENGTKIEDIIAIKGPFGRAINDGIIKEYDIKAIITKDSGLEGGVKEKVESALENNAKVILLNKPKVQYGVSFNNVKDLIYVIKKELGE